MKKVFTLFLAAVMVLSGCVTQIGTKQAEPAEPIGIAAAFVEMIGTGAYAEAWEMLDETMRSVIPSADVLAEAWASITAFTGEFQEIVRTDAEFNPAAGTTAYEIIALHEEPSMLTHTTVIFDEDGKIPGFSIVIIANPEFAAEASDLFTEEPIFVGAGGKYPLPGLLTMPADAEGPVPAVVIVHGSGPIDRDCTIFYTKPYRDIAHYLAANGIASVRYDKRTLVYAEEMVSPIEYYMEYTVDWEMVDDALLAKELLEADPRIDSGRIYVIGHSLGGVLAPEIAATGDFAGFVIMAGTLIPLTEAVVHQYEHLLQDVPAEIAEPLMAEARLAHELFLEAMTKTEEENKTYFIHGFPANYVVNLAKRSPVPFIQAWERPGLILHGDMDYQCRWDIDFVEYMRITEGMDNIEGILYENLTHLFTQSYSTTGMGTADDYAVPGHVDEAVLRDIVRFILN
ncbi:MAG: alpha/beta fold hydrolase [Defluviitaleaceae bacterium]|nr:alpha/beta fold hydrolase [Defluviitaleaceae bacterium]MCL2835156.1 alpha/beta fold hydrolase [Defluviitaleaceae bacterium]